MSDTTLITPTLSMLPIDDLADLLRNDSKYDFAKRTDTAPDTLTVSGIDSKVIAVAATDEKGDLIDKRDTINNSLKLGGIPAKDYLLTKDAQDIKNLAINLSEIYGKQISLLKDELYQLKEELSKKGLAEDYTLYAGFHDLFKNSKKLYSNSFNEDYDLKRENIVCKLSYDSLGTSNIIYPENIELFEEGEYIILEKENVGTPNVIKLTKIIKKDKDKNALTLDTVFSDLTINSTHIYKTLGEYHFGTFSFSKLQQDVIVPNTIARNIFNDALNTSSIILNKSNKGYATKLYVPLSMQGGLHSYSVYAKTIGNPGNLKCYLIAKDKIGNVQFDTNNNPITYTLKLDSLDKETLLAVSKPATINSKGEFSELLFDFTQENLKAVKLNNDYYYFLIIGEDIDEFNFYELKANYHLNPVDSSKQDLQSDMLLYCCDKVRNTDNTYDYNFYGDSYYPYDIVCILSTNPIIKYMEEPFEYGLYTSVFNTPSPIKSSKARLTLRIAKEGRFFIADSFISPNSTINISNKGDSIIGGTYGISQGETVIIDNNICTYTGTSIAEIDKAIADCQDKQIYRVGYDIVLLAWRTEFDETTKTYIKKSCTKKMNLVSVIPDNLNSDSTSDRLIYECDLDTISNNNKYNNFEIQIAWKSNLSKDIIRKANKINNINDENNESQFIGRIKSFSLSLNELL